MVMIVKDPDAAFERAVIAGANVVWPVSNQPYGWRVGQIVDRRCKLSCDDMRKATTGLGIDSQIGVAAFYRKRVCAAGVLLSQSSIPLKPRLVYIG